MGLTINPNLLNQKHPLPPLHGVDKFRPADTLGAPEEIKLAMDAALDSAGVYSYIQNSFGPGTCNSDISTFLGYAFLSTLTQNGLVRAGVETVSNEMTRKWIEIIREDKDNEFFSATEISKETERLSLKDVFQQAAQWVGYFGGCLVYIDTGVSDLEELRTPLFLDPYLFKKDSLKGFVPIEPINIYPGLYNAIDPTDPCYFNPSTWWVLGKEYHKSRFLYFTSGTLPILLRPAYNFFGVSMAQLCLDYVMHFTQCRESAARFLTKFSFPVLKTNLENILQGAESDANFQRRMQYFIQTLSNDGCMVVDKETEDLTRVSASLAGITDIVTQSLELLAAIFRIPAVKLLGISPSGFNATGESDIRNYYDHVSSQQEKVFYEPLKYALDVIQMNKFGEIDRGVSFKFLPLGEEDRRLQSDINKLKADIDAQYLDRGVLMPEMVLDRLSADPESGYNLITEKDVEEVDQESSLDHEYLEPEQESTIQEVSLDGGQIKSLLEIVTQVSQGIIPRDAGVQILLTAFPIDINHAEKLMGSSGLDFNPKPIPEGEKVYAA